MTSAVSCRSGHQSRDSEQIIGGANRIGIHLHPLASAVAGLAQTTDGLHPAKRLLDARAYPLADRVIPPLFMFPPASAGKLFKELRRLQLPFMTADPATLMPL